MQHMNSLSTRQVGETLQRLFQEAEEADRTVMEQFATTETPAQLIAEYVAAEIRDVRGVCRDYIENFLNVSPEYGEFLYQCARMR